jgi:hypothetical protein
MRRSDAVREAGGGASFGWTAALNDLQRTCTGARSETTSTATRLGPIGFQTSLERPLKMPEIEDMGPRARAVYLDIDINGSRDAFKRATEFVATSSIKYGLSTDDVTKLGGAYRAPSASRRGTKLSTRAPYELQTAALTHGPNCDGDCLPVAPVLDQRDGCVGGWT